MIFSLWIAKFLNSGAPRCCACGIVGILVLFVCRRDWRRQPGARYHFGRRGFARRLCCGCGRCALVTSIPAVREWCHAFALVALLAVCCCVCCSVPAASVRIPCFLSWPAAWGVVCVLLFLHRWFALMGWLSVLECAFGGFLPLFTLLQLFPR